jgi:5-methylthioribose kinase
MGPVLVSYIIVNTFFFSLVSSSFFQGADSKREEFRKYLEKAGVLDALTKGMTR